MRTIKMIWDFKGEEGKGTAEHHLVHLKEFAAKHQLNECKVSVSSLSELHHTANMEVKEEHLILVRDALRPHRAQWVEEA